MFSQHIKDTLLSFALARFVFSLSDLLAQGVEVAAPALSNLLPTIPVRQMDDMFPADIFE
jgi:hypothetical protein